MNSEPTNGEVAKISLVSITPPPQIIAATLHIYENEPVPLLRLVTAINGRIM